MSSTSSFYRALEGTWFSCQQEAPKVRLNMHLPQLSPAPAPASSIDEPAVFVMCRNAIKGFWIVVESFLGNTSLFVKLEMLSSSIEIKSLLLAVSLLQVFAVEFRHKIPFENLVVERIDARDNAARMNTITMTFCELQRVVAAINRDAMVRLVAAPVSILLFCN